MSEFMWKSPFQLRSFVKYFSWDEARELVYRSIWVSCWIFFKANTSTVSCKRGFISSCSIHPLFSLIRSISREFSQYDLPVDTTSWPIRYFTLWVQTKLLAENTKPDYGLMIWGFSSGLTNPFHSFSADHPSEMTSPISLFFQIGIAPASA